MRNLSKRILSCMIAILMSVTIAITASAAGIKNDLYSEKGLFLLSSDVPEEAVEYTENTIGGMIHDIYDVNSITVGKPFVVEGHSCDLYYFLVYNNGKVVGVYRVFNTENGYTGIFSENPELVENLEKLKKLTTDRNPARIVVGDYEDIYAIMSNGQVVQILTDPMGRATEIGNTDIMASSMSLSLSVINATDSVEFTVSSTVPLATSSTYKYLQIGWSETQGSEPWCAAYATASICRYRLRGLGSNITADITALKIMQFTYPNLSMSALKQESLSRSAAIAYANYKGFDPKQKNGRLSWKNIKSEIDADCPIYFGCDNLTNNRKSSHALVCRGYNENNGNPFYSIWNPWYTKYERMYTSNYIYTTEGGTQYEYDRTIYRWRA